MEDRISVGVNENRVDLFILERFFIGNIYIDLEIKVITI